MYDVISFGFFSGLENLESQAWVIEGINKRLKFSSATSHMEGNTDQVQSEFFAF